MCERCGGRLNKGNTTGFCSSTPECKLKAREIQARRWRQRRAATTAARRGPCDVCGEPLLRLTKYGVCSRSQACRNEATQRSKRANPESSRRAHAKREAASLARTGLERWRRRRIERVRRLAERQEMVCPWCGQQLPSGLAGVDIDHIIPVASGIVVHEEWNLQVLHRSCNCSKRDKITPRAIELAAEHGLVLAA